MFPGVEMLACPNLAVPMDVMRHVVRVESSNNPYAIGVVGGRLKRQPSSLDEAVATARMLEGRGANFSLGLAQVNRYNLGRYGLESYEQAFDACGNLLAGSRILAECLTRAGGDWGKAFSCYYSGNFTTGYRDGYVQKVFAAMASPPPYPKIPRAGIAGLAAATANARSVQGRDDASWPAASRFEYAPPRRSALQVEAVGASAPPPAYDQPAGATSWPIRSATPTQSVAEESLGGAASGQPSNPAGAAAPARGSASAVVPRDTAFVF